MRTTMRRHNATTKSPKRKDNYREVLSRPLDSRLIKRSSTQLPSSVQHTLEISCTCQTRTRALLILALNTA